MSLVATWTSQLVSSVHLGRRFLRPMSTARCIVLDDYQRVARQFADWSCLGPALRLEFFQDCADDWTQAGDQPKLVERCADQGSRQNVVTRKARRCDAASEAFPDPPDATGAAGRPWW